MCVFDKNIYTVLTCLCRDLVEVLVSSYNDKTWQYSPVNIF